jgi:hypothetical protein
MMIIVLPASLMAQSSGAAILHSEGGVWLNHNLAPTSSAIFPNDLIQTAKGTQAKIDAGGSAVTVQPDTIVEFDGDELLLDHGGLQVITSRALRVRVNCVTVTPVLLEWTRYDITDTDGKVHVAANQDDVKIHYSGAAGAQHSKQPAPSDATVHQGEEATREERCGVAAKLDKMVDADGPLLDHLWVKIAGVVIIGVVTCWALCRGDDPISPDKP